MHEFERGIVLPSCDARLAKHAETTEQIKSEKALSDVSKSAELAHDLVGVWFWTTALGI